MSDRLRPELFECIDDYAQWLLLSQRTKFRRIPELLSSWRSHDDQATKKKANLIVLEQWMLIKKVSQGESGFRANVKLAKKMASSLWVIQYLANTLPDAPQVEFPSFFAKSKGLARFSLRHPIVVLARLLRVWRKPNHLRLQ